MQSFKFTVSAICSIAVLSACSSTPVSTANNDAAKGKPDQRTVATYDASKNNENDQMAQRSVYFDFDSYVLKDDGRTVVTTQAKYLAKHPHKIVVQGNTDERGGSEYNLALGQRRAEAVKKSLSLMGISDSQIEAVSFGKEKPMATGHDEASWSQNRRADIAYQ